MVLKAMKNSLKRIVRKNIFVKKKKKFYEKKPKFGQKNILGNFLKFRNFPKFLSSDIFLRSHEKQCFSHFDTPNATSCMTQQWLLRYQMSSVPYGRLLIVWDITITSALDCMSRTNQSSSSHRCLYRHQ